MAFDVDEEMSGMEEKIIAIMCFKFLTIKICSQFSAAKLNFIQELLQFIYSPFLKSYLATLLAYLP